MRQIQEIYFPLSDGSQTSNSKNGDNRHQLCLVKEDNHTIFLSYSIIQDIYLRSNHQTMKLLFSSALLLAASLTTTTTTAFVIPQSQRQQHFTPAALKSTVRPDASQAIQDALAASEKYGAGSPEARIAWEVVEDMDSADNRYVVFYTDSMAIM